MFQIGRINCYSHATVPNEWRRFDKNIGINRLYYIHGGEGGYWHNGKQYPFCKDCLYFIPYTADFTPYCNSNNPILHTYADFELIPPILTEQILIAEVGGDPMAEAALTVFISGGKRLGNRRLHDSDFFRDEEFRRFCTESMLYLISYVTRLNGIPPLSDELVLRALSVMHTQMKEKLTVTKLAQSYFLTEDTFIRRFSKVVGVTPYAYLKNLRLQTALCLRESGMSLSEVAREVGYSDASSLLHAMTKKFKINLTHKEKYGTMNPTNPNSTRRFP